jgi:SAM-dependent methyltransferase
METGYKVFKREVLDHIRLKSNRFGFEPEVTAKIAKMNCRIYEVPISYSGRDYWEGKKIKWTDGVKAILAILRYNFFEPETDDIVYQSLQKLKKFHRYNRWIYTKFRPFLGRRVLEIGSGTGNITKFLLDRDAVIATDIEPRYLEVLRNIFGRYKNIVVEKFDVSTPDAERFHKYEVDTVIAFNVLEHVEPDETALKNTFDILRPGGRLLLLTPSHPRLYGSLDRSLGHRRRYRKEDLRKKLEAAGFTVERLKYFNRFAAAGWYLNGRILRRRTLPSFQLSFYNLLIPLFKIEGLIPLPFGTSLLVVAERPKEWRPSSTSQNS